MGTHPPELALFLLKKHLNKNLLNFGESKMQNNRLVRVGMLGVIALALIVGCNSKQSTSSMKELTGDPNAPNIALLFSDDSNLVGPDYDITNFSAFLRSVNHQYRFGIHEGRKASKATILENTSQALRRVGENGTLLWYFSGHGVPDRGGAVVTAGGSYLYYSELSNAIARVRQTPIKRLILLVDACFSGTAVSDQSPFAPTGSQTSQGTNSVAAQDNAGVERLVIDHANAARAQIAALKLPNGKPLFEQVVVATAARANETAADLATKGGAFTRAFLEVFNELYQAHVVEPGGSGTIAHLMSTTQSRVAKDHGHTPVWLTFPSWVSEATLFDTTGNAQTQAQQINSTQTNATQTNVQQNQNVSSPSPSATTTATFTPNDPDNDRDGDGIPDSQDACLISAKGAQVHKSERMRDYYGCASGESRNMEGSQALLSSYGDDDGDGVRNWADKCPRTDSAKFNIFKGGIHLKNQGSSRGYVGCAAGETPSVRA